MPHCENRASSASVEYVAHAGRRRAIHQVVKQTLGTSAKMKKEKKLS
jgi:copper oxidase (laccase) domain-containing protein